MTLVDTRYTARGPFCCAAASPLTPSVSRSQLPDHVHDSWSSPARTQWLAHNNAVFDVAWCDGDDKLLTASGDQRCKLWDAETRTCLLSLRGHGGSVKSVATRRELPWAALSGSRDGSVALWDMRQPQRSRTRAGVLDVFLPPAGSVKARPSYFCFCFCSAQTL